MNWNDLPINEQDNLRNQIMAMFPEIFGPKRNTKYVRVRDWLEEECDIQNSALRDEFSSGGKVFNVTFGGGTADLPHVFGVLRNNIAQVVHHIQHLDSESLAESWQEAHVSADPADRLNIWVNLVDPLARNFINNADFDIRGYIISLINSVP